MSSRDRAPDSPARSRARRLPRRVLLGLAGAAAAGAATAAYARWVEPGWMKLDERAVALPIPPRRPVRILHLSDLHWSHDVARSAIARAIELGLAQRPDFVCLTGDYVTAGDDRDWNDYRPLLERVAAAAPTFAVLGNHDGGTWCTHRGGFPTVEPVGELLRSCGIRVLRNEAVVLEDPGLRLVGVDDLWAGGCDPRRAFGALDGTAPVATVVLAHNPDTKDVLAEHAWHLMLSGHTHGGQIALPLLGPPYAPVRDARYVAGLRPWRDRQVYVSRGVGNLRGFRFGCRPEVGVLDLGL